MKKLVSIFLLFITMIMTSVSCSKAESNFKLLDKEGIAPYELSDRDKYLLQAFNIDNNYQIISFKAPKEAVTLRVNVYSLKDGSNWENLGECAVSIGSERESDEQSAGTFTMSLKENYSMDLNIINTNGRASYKTEELTFDSEGISSTRRFLTELHNIELNKEIPVAVMVYDSGSSIQSYSLQDYFEPSKFKGMDLAQFVTLTFTDKEL